MSASTPSARRARYLGRYAARLLVDKGARDARRARTHLRALRKINPSFQVLGVSEDGGTTFVHATDEVITPILLGRGHFQRTDFQRCHDLATRLAPRPGASVFVDVGANVGTTTLYAARTGAFQRIVAMEPSPDNLRVLRLNVQTNDLDDVVQVVEAACGATEGNVQLMLSSVSAGDHRVQRAGEVLTSHQTLVDVPQRPLDAVLESAGVRPEDLALVWIDTQGHEPSVLAGADEAMASGAAFVIEFWPEMYEQAGTLGSLLELLRERFSRYVDVREEGEVLHPMSDLEPLATRLLGEWHGQTDLVLLRD